MMTSSLALFISGVLAFGLALGIRAGLGAERAARFVGLAVPVAFLLGWAAIVRPGWYAYDAIGRLSHLVVGAALVGLICDAWLPRRGAIVIGALGVVIVSAWAEVNGGLWPQGRMTPALLGAFAIAVAVGTGMLWRLARLRAQEQAHLLPALAILVTLTMLSLALAAVAAAAGDAPLWRGGVVLAGALAGFALWTWIAHVETSPTATLLPATLGILGIAWALYERSPFTGLGLAIAGLILFASGTAGAVRLPKAGISRILAPFILAGVAVAPLALAAAVTLALRAGK